MGGMAEPSAVQEILHLFSGPASASEERHDGLLQRLAKRIEPALPCNELVKAPEHGYPLSLYIAAYIAARLRLRSPPL
jgi:hypothetical protein